MKMTTELKVGVFALIVIGLLSLMTFWVGGLAWLKKPGYILYVYFNDVSGLDKKSKILVAGVDAGYIEDITLMDGMAKLKLRINRNVALYSDAQASISSMGLLGEKYLAIKTGAKPPTLTNGQTITNAVSSVSMDDLMRKISDLSTSLTKVVGKVNEVLSPEQIKSLRTAIDNVRKITQNVNTSVIEDNDKIKTALDNVNSLISTVRDTAQKNDKNITELIANLKDFSQTLRQEAPSLISNIRDTSAQVKNLVKESKPGIESIINSTSQITAGLRQGKGTLGKLLTDQALYNNLNSSVKGLKDTFGAINRFRVYLDFQGNYLSRGSGGEGQFLVTLQPRPDKYYIVGVVSNPIARIDKIQQFNSQTNQIETTQENVHSDIEFLGQFARRFYNTAFRIGVTDNTFGVGADQFFLNDRLKLSMDAWDFSAREAFARHAHLRVGGQYFLFKHIYLSGGWDNPLNAHWSGPYVGAGLRFEDEDLKYLFAISPAKL
ncbi:MAG: MlaD family protein [Nitrospiraceae bacterium]|nr:MlaD family protein [Nitrospiraceae bacterium]